MSVARILPHPRVQVMEWDTDGYPASILVHMGNNTEAEYVRKVDQPKPHVVIGERLAEMIRSNTYGYQAKHEKK